MKELIKTGICTLVLCLVTFLGFLIYSRVNYTINHSNDIVLDNDDPVVEMLYKKVNRNDLLRLASMNSDSLDNDLVIKYILLTLDKEDYVLKKYEHTKIVCEINSKVSFISDSDCNVLVVKNKLFKERQETLFNRSTDLVFNDFEFRGYECKNDGKNYYCIKHSYTPSTKSYSLVKEAIQSGDEVILYEYYLNINLEDIDVCSEYYYEEICSNYAANYSSLPDVSEDVIKKNGTIYKHVFAKNNDVYYLKSSTIISE